MVLINWHDIRPWEGSQQKGFEEVCAQLAASEPNVAGAVFVRKGTQDAGVECYWRSSDGDERGWQAKHFHTLGPSQWSQLDASVRTALEKHPRLVEYIICIPRDLADARQEDKTSAQDQWTEHVHKWEIWARGTGREVCFTYWGAHELGMRLLRDEHRGRLLYWFNKQLFSRQWFEDRLEEAIANADQRYLPQLNVDLPINQVFEGLGRTAEFYDELRAQCGKVRRAHQQVNQQGLDTIAPNDLKLLQQEVTTLTQTIASLDPSTTQQIPLGRIKELTDAIGSAASRIERAIWNAGEQEQQSPTKPAVPSRRPSDAQAYYVRQVVREIDELAYFASTHGALLANKPALLLVGSAGTGKTHLLCHLARLRHIVDRPTLLILSEQLADGEPWTELLSILQVTADADAFLGALNAAGQARRSRVLLIIDALNEGEGRAMWERHLPGFLRRVARYPWVGLVVSIRKSYEELATASVDAQALLRVEHRGFHGAEPRAAVHFFSHYGIIAPTIPPLHPEFANPLFLRLFCQAVKNMGYQQIPPGLHGLTKVFEFFLDSVNKKVCSPACLDVDEAARLVHGCVDQIAAAMADQQTHWLPYGDAKVLVDACYRAQGFTRSLFHQLLLEGVLARDQFYTVSDPRVEGIRFTYEKFSDHLIAMHLLTKHWRATDPMGCFGAGAVLGDLVADDWSCRRQRGIIEALAVQVPERCGKELFELAPHCAAFSTVREAIIDSIVWRAPTAFTEETFLPYLNRYLLWPEDTFAYTMGALLTVATQVGHPFNAKFLHRNLMRMPLADRDAWWSTFLHHQYSEELDADRSGALTRLLDWCEIDDGKSDLADDAVLLAGITISWFLTSSDRFLRDRSTKALVRLFTPRIGVLTLLIREFLAVDDPYVLERVIAVAYGCAMRSEDRLGLLAVAQVCYDAFFVTEVPVHVLLRDYARGTIERAKYLNPTAPFARKRLVPPYGSTWPAELPTIEALKADASYGNAVTPWSAGRIYSSVMADDFGSYVIGTNSGGFEWKNVRLSDALPLSLGELKSAFVARLTPAQRVLWLRFARLYHLERRRSFRLGPELRWQENGLTIAFGERNAGGRGKVDAAKRALYETLSHEQQQALEEHAVAFLDKGNRRFGEEHRFPLSLLQRYIVARAYNLGWTVERFGEFDRSIRSSGRESHKPERMGKKYQWIAYHEGLARVADNFVFAKDSWGHNPIPFAGAWQLTGLRDLDPSFLVDGPRTAGSEADVPWWAPAPYADWYSIALHEEWFRATSDLSSMAEYLCVTDPADGSRWLNLEAHYHWSEPTPSGEEWSERSHREVGHWLQAYVVRKDDFDELLAWGQQQNFWGRWMPESHNVGELFLGELYWSPAYRMLCKEDRGAGAWVRGDMNGRLPKPVVVAGWTYDAESQGYDCSIKDSVSIYVPSPWLAEHLVMRWRGVAGEFVGPEGVVVARDPSMSAGGPRALLVRESVLREFLDREGLELLWTVQGMKWLLGEHPPLRQELQINGAFGFRDGKVVGSATPRFRDYDREQGTDRKS